MLAIDICDARIDGDRGNRKNNTLEKERAIQRQVR